MKYNFSFIQVVNWLLVCKQKALKLCDNIKNGRESKQDLIIELEMQKQNLLLVKDILNRKVKLQGVNAEFLKNFKQLKKDYGLED